MCRTDNANIFEGIIPNGLFGPPINIVGTYQRSSLDRRNLRSKNIVLLETQGHRGRQEPDQLRTFL